MSKMPKWYTPITIVALIWNLLGCVAYLSDVRMTHEDVARLTVAQQELYASRTIWSVSATAIAVWCGAAGSLGLILRKRWAMPLLLASVVGLIVQDFGLFVLTKAVSLAGPVVLILQGLVLFIALGLVWLGRRAIANGWIPKEVIQK
jgi:hypothetical protein